MNRWKLKKPVLPLIHLWLVCSKFPHNMLRADLKWRSETRPKTVLHSMKPRHIIRVQITIVLNPTMNCEPLWEILINGFSHWINSKSNETFDKKLSTYKLLRFQTIEVLNPYGMHFHGVVIFGLFNLIQILSTCFIQSQANFFLHDTWIWSGS